MEVRAVPDAASFLAAVEPLLLADEARHNLMIGIARALAVRPEPFPSLRL